MSMAWNKYTNKNSNLKCIHVKHVLIRRLFEQTTYQQKYMDWTDKWDGSSPEDVLCLSTNDLEQ